MPHPSGQVTVGLCVREAGVNKTDEDVRKELSPMIRDQIGGIASYRENVVVKRRPKTRSC